MLHYCSMVADFATPDRDCNMNYIEKILGVLLMIVIGFSLAGVVVFGPLMQ